MRTLLWCSALGLLATALALDTASARGEGAEACLNENAFHGGPPQCGSPLDPPQPRLCVNGSPTWKQPACGSVLCILGLCAPDS